MDQPMKRECNVWRYVDGRIKKITDIIVTEFPVTIILNEKEFATLVCSPEHIEELVIGFLASEGVINSFKDIKELTFIEATGRAIVHTHKINRWNELFHSKRYITSCCGKSRQSFYFYNDARTVKPVENIDITISIEQCFQLMQLMEESSVVFQDTGGVHNAVLCNANEIIVNRIDIGRHNALDKIYGYCLQNLITRSDKIIVFSGRISSEVLLKAAKIGCGIILSKSAPTELALRLAEELNVTTVGFLRNKSLNIYTRPDRIYVHGAQ
ncbi:formate dehydrogenase accessory sulfurtransferase FdhD [Bacillus sp. BRMEA1]|uniref:formate dehydrogenase accessory sulfurtransferase FdhD n=1 Tax=Neobacillus endophyticus TaxID=2738405 RepID=UPI0015676448|nr:formate dehydrogenase accessory sulfurtransferase FdhD [Neobacillus endophyticus]NRD80064.1 formate dehydrogenase accessory sulfurtransferase FdhD [Neobacillus endophyticus]